MRKCIILLLLILLHYNSVEELLLKQSVACFLIANLEKDQLRSGSVTFLQSGITLPGNLQIALVEDRLKEHNLRTKGSRPLKQEECPV